MVPKVYKLSTHSLTERNAGIAGLLHVAEGMLPLVRFCFELTPVEAVRPEGQGVAAAGIGPGVRWSNPAGPTNFAVCGRQWSTAHRSSPARKGLTNHQSSYLTRAGAV